MNPRSMTILLTAATVSLAPVTPSAQADSPPKNALRRYDPEKYQIKFDVTIQQTTAAADPSRRGRFQFQEAPIVFPVIYMGSYSKVFPKSEGGQVFLDGTPVKDLTWRIQEGKPFQTHQIEMVAPEFTGVTVKWYVEFVTQSWSSDINEQLAQQSAWPRNMEWPDDVQDGLRPQKFIESDHEVFARIVKENGGEQLRTISPYMAAKQVVAFVLNNFQVSGNSVPRGALGQIQGLGVRGALATVTNPDPIGRWIGTDHDLVCVCVAMLRAAGIPARPVIGIVEEQRTRRQRTTFISWAEFYLPESGWVPFDPARMLDEGSGRYRVFTDRWEWFGLIEGLNQRVPLSHHFHPPASGTVAPGFPAVWGWDPRPAQKPYYEQSISLQITGRGPGEKDPGQ